MLFFQLFLETTTQKIPSIRWPPNALIPTFRIEELGSHAMLFQNKIKSTTKNYKKQTKFFCKKKE
jgi:hypothetical protein